MGTIAHAICLICVCNIIPNYDCSQSGNTSLSQLHWSEFYQVQVLRVDIRWHLSVTLLSLWQNLGIKMFPQHFFSLRKLSFEQRVLGNKRDLDKNFPNKRFLSQSEFRGWCIAIQVIKWEIKELVPAHHLPLPQGEHIIQIRLHHGNNHLYIMPANKSHHAFYLPNYHASASCFNKIT